MPYKRPLTPEQKLKIAAARHRHWVKHREELTRKCRERYAKHKRVFTPEQKRNRTLTRYQWWLKRRQEEERNHPERFIKPPPIDDEKHRRHRAAWKRSYEKHKERYKEKRRAKYQANKHWLYVRNYRRALQEVEANRPKPTCCEVCGDNKVRIEFDHCHQSGRFRGWLCTHCNIIIGHARDDPNRLRKLITYLERTNGG